MEVVTQHKLARTWIGIVFVCLLAIPLLYKYVVHKRQSSGMAQNRALALSHYGFDMQEVSRQIGINFVHKAPTLDPKLKHIMEQVA